MDDFKKIGENIFNEAVFWVESKINEWSLVIFADEYLEHVTAKVIRESEKYRSPLVIAEAKRRLRDFLSQYTPYKVDKEEIIELYFERYKESERLRKAKDIIRDIDITNITKIEQNIENLLKAKNLILSNGDIVIKDGSETVKKNLKEGFQNAGVSSGVIQLDDIIEKFSNGEMTIIASRPGVGKTALMCQCISNISKKYHVGVFSAEMTADKIMNRILACETGIDSKRLSRYSEKTPSVLTEKEIAIVAEKHNSLSNRVIKIADHDRINIDMLAESAKTMKEMYNIDILLADYLQLFTTDQNKLSRVEELGYISRMLKSLSISLDIPVVSLAQLNRDADGKRPTMKDLKGSGDIEQDADLIILMHEIGASELIDMPTELIVTKNRNGKKGWCKIMHHKSISRFVYELY